MKRLTMAIIVIFILTQQGNCALNLIKDIVQYNLVGHPVLHQNTEYNFHPDIGPRQARLYQQVNGIYGEKAIERLGLGIDGYHQERLIQQRIRDNGHIGRH